jgi:hypothetical protein
MVALLNAEGQSATRRAKLTRSFNRGYRGYRRTYRACNKSASLLISRFMNEGAELANKHARLRRECMEIRKKAGQAGVQLRREVARRSAIRRRRHEEEARTLMEAIAQNHAPSESSPLPITPARNVPSGSSGKEFIIVSGLPRSGTSLMMQMLAAGGVPLKTDGKRAADQDNPLGYFEWEGVKRVGRNPDVLRAADGKAFKAVSLLLSRLPRVHRYRVVFMRRPPEEIAASQRRMLERHGKRHAGVQSGRLGDLLRKHQSRAIVLLQQAPNTEVLVVDYPDLIAEPTEAARRVCDFLVPHVVSGPNAMASVVRPDLWHQRADDLERTVQP